MSVPSPRPLLFVTGLSGAGKTTALTALEDSGWETVDNFPVRLAERLLQTPPAAGHEDEMPLALGFDSRTRGFLPDTLAGHIRRIGSDTGLAVALLYLDCSDAELQRRYGETRRRHPMAPDRSLEDGIAMERAQLEPLRDSAEWVIDTSRLSANDLKALIRSRFATGSSAANVLQVVSFGYAHGIPPAADLVFDMRFLDNPHWQPHLRGLDGRDAPVAAFIGRDPSLDEALSRIKDLLLVLLPKYEAQAKAYVTIAFGCTGGRHRSVFVAELIGKWLVEAGFSPIVVHRNLGSAPHDALEGLPQ